MFSARTLVARLAISLATCVTACGGGDDEAPPIGPPRVNAIARDPGLGLRCRVRDALDTRVSLGTRETPVAVGGVAQPFWLTTTWAVRDGEKVASSLGMVDALDALGANRWLSFARGSLNLHDQVGVAGRAVRALPNACDVRILGGRGGAWIVYRRASNGCFGDASQGPLVMLRASESGQQFEQFSPMGDSPTRAVKARIDAGRLVVEVQILDRSWRTTVLDLEGTVLTQPATSGVVCPRSGCQVVEVARSQLQFRSTDVLLGEVRPHGLGETNELYSLTTGPGRIVALAVHDHFVLVVQQEENNNRHTFAIVDTLARRIETVFDARARAGVDLWNDSIANNSLRVSATERGFAYVASGASGELVAREVDCEL